MVNTFERFESLKCFVHVICIPYGLVIANLYDYIMRKGTHPFMVSCKIIFIEMY